MDFDYDEPQIHNGRKLSGVRLREPKGVSTKAAPAAVAIAPGAKGTTVTTRPLKFLEADYNRLAAAARRRHLPVEELIGQMAIGESTRGSISKSLARFGDYTGDTKCGGTAERATDDEVLWAGLVEIEKEVDRLLALFSAPAEDEDA